jgi:class 3 adenylate cyclase
VTLQAALLSLLLATVVGLTLIAYRTQTEAVDVLEARLLSSTTEMLSDRLTDYLDIIPRVLADLDLRATYERLSLDDLDELGDFLADRLRYEHTLSQLSYVEGASGSTVSARRTDDGQIALGRSDLAVEGGRLRAWLVAPDGSRAPYALDMPSVDPRTLPIYRAALASDDPVWLPPFQTRDGIPTMGASSAVHDPRGGAPTGVFNAQIFLAVLPAMLRQATSHQPEAQAVLITRQGEPLAASRPLIPERWQEAVSDLPTPFAELPLDTPIPLEFRYAGTAFIGGVQGFRTLGDADYFVGLYLPEKDLLAAILQSEQKALAAGAGLLAVGVLLGILLAARIARPLGLIAADLREVAQFRLSSGPAPRSFVSEVATVADAVERMKASLRSFGRYVPTDLVRELLAEGEEARLGGDTRVLTIHFSDIENFTHLSEHRTPTELVRDLAEYLHCMSDTIRASDGTIDKFIGDGVMAFWNAPGVVPDHAARACRAALQAQERLALLRPRWEAAGQPAFRARIGLHSGEVIVGNFGTDERFAYTALGDGVNLASRLESLNKSYGTYIMASDAVRAAAGPAFEWRRLDRVAVAGRSEGTDVYELLGERGTVAAPVLRARDLYEQALEAYFARRFGEAVVGFRAAGEARPDDKAANVLAQRAGDLSTYAPPPDWSGIYVSSSK